MGDVHAGFALALVGFFFPFWSGLALVPAMAPMRLTSAPSAGHGAAAVGASGVAASILLPVCRRYWPSTTTCSFAARPLSISAWAPWVWTTVTVAHLDRLVRLHDPGIIAALGTVLHHGRRHHGQAVLAGSRPGRCALTNCPGQSAPSWHSGRSPSASPSPVVVIDLVVDQFEHAVGQHGLVLSRPKAMTGRLFARRPGPWSRTADCRPASVKITEIGWIWVMVTNRPLLSDAWMMLPISTLRIPVRPSIGELIVV